MDVRTVVEAQSKAVADSKPIKNRDAFTTSLGVIAATLGISPSAWAIFGNSPR